MNIQDLLRKYISDELFEDLSSFAEELYLMNYEYIILMARKFYNLFCVFHELNCQKYEKLGIPYKSDVKIVSNRALPLLKHFLKQGEHKIALGDDIIIHGRGIRDLYNKLHEENPKLDITIETFVINNDDTSIYEDILDKIHSYYEVPADRWRDISDRIVASFWLSGRPYISYLPFFVLDTTWQELIQKLDYNECITVTNFDLNYYGVDLLVYYGKEFDPVQKLKCCNIAAVRFYHYKNIDKITAIPYFCTNALNEENTITLSDELRNSLFEKEYLSIVASNNGAEEMRLLEFEYTMSLFLAKVLFDKTGLRIKEWSRDIERSTFSNYIIKHKTFDEIDAEKHLNSIVQVDANISCAEPAFPDNEEVLVTGYKNIKKRYREQYNILNNKKTWTGEKDLLQEYIEEILLMNGNLDEERCKKSDYEERTRLLGIPVSFLLADSSNFWASLNRSENIDYYKKRVFSDIIAAIDSGKGSIIIKSVGNGSSNNVNESLLHAGEQNYKYYEATNYPYMYGLILIEYESKIKPFKKGPKYLKREFQKKFNNYLDHQNIKYSIEEQEQLLSINMMNQYGRFLLHITNKYKDNIVLENARKLALKTIAENLDG